MDRRDFLTVGKAKKKAPAIVKPVDNQYLRHVH